MGWFEYLNITETWRTVSTTWVQVRVIAAEIDNRVSQRIPSLDCPLTDSKKNSASNSSTSSKAVTSTSTKPPSSSSFATSSSATSPHSTTNKASAGR